MKSDHIMSYLIDLLLLVVVAICAWHHYKKGFISTLLSLIALALAMVVALPIANYLTPKCSDRYVTPFLNKTIEKHLSDDEFADESEKAAELLTVMENYCSDEYENTEWMKKITDEVEKHSGVVYGDELAQAKNYLVDDMSAKITFGLLFLLLVLALRLLFGFFLNRLGFIDKFPVIHGISHFLGLMLGVVIGLLAAYIVSQLLNAFSATLSMRLPAIFPRGFEKKMIFLRLPFYR